MDAHAFSRIVRSITSCVVLGVRLEISNQSSSYHTLLVHACERSCAYSIEPRLSRYTRNATFLTDSTLATKDPTATPYALFRGLANWWVCHLTKEDTGSQPQAANLSSDADRNRTLNGSYKYVDEDDCAYEDSNYYTRPSRHPQS